MCIHAREASERWRKNWFLIDFLCLSISLIHFNWSHTPRAWGGEAKRDFFHLNFNKLATLLKYISKNEEEKCCFDFLLLLAWPSTRWSEVSTHELIEFWALGDEILSTSTLFYGDNETYLRNYYCTGNWFDWHISVMDEWGNCNESWIAVAKYFSFTFDQLSCALAVSMRKFAMLPHLLRSIL